MDLQHLYCKLTLKTLRYGSQFYLQITPYLPLPRKRSSDGATSNWGGRYLIAAYLLPFTDPESMKISLVGWPTAESLPTKWSPISCRSSTGQGKFVSRRLMIYQVCNATNPTIFYFCTVPCCLGDLLKIFMMLMRCLRQGNYSCSNLCAILLTAFIICCRLTRMCVITWEKEDIVMN